jgi:uncharacterized Zn finger protein
MNCSNEFCGNCNCNQSHEVQKEGIKSGVGYFVKYVCRQCGSFFKGSMSFARWAKKFRSKMFDNNDA